MASARIAPVNGLPMSDFQHLRSAERRPALMRGRLNLGPDRSLVDVEVRNFSATGAKIVVEETLQLPAQFELTILLRQETFRARCAWRRGREVGVAFVIEEKPVLSPEDEIDARIATLEAENAVLRGKLKQLAKELQMRNDLDRAAG